MRVLLSLRALDQEGTNAACEVELHKRQLGKVVLELFGDVVPKTVENFRCLCTGDRDVESLYY